MILYTRVLPGLPEKFNDEGCGLLTLLVEQLSLVSIVQELITPHLTSKGPVFLLFLYLPTDSVPGYYFPLSPLLISFWAYVPTLSVTTLPYPYDLQYVQFYSGMIGMIRYDTAHGSQSRSLGCYK